MRKVTKTFLATAAAGVLSVGLGVTPSAATTATTWTVKPGGSFSGKGNRSFYFRDTTVKSKTVLGCEYPSVSGSFRSGSGLPAKIATVTTVNFHNCQAGIIVDASITNGNIVYDLNAVSYDAERGVVTLSITGIHANLAGPGCTGTIDGTGPEADDGTVAAEYKNSTGKLQFTPDANQSNLHFYSSLPASNCWGFLRNGDHLTIGGTFILKPGQTITSQ